MTQADLLRDAVQALKFRRYDAALAATTTLLPGATDAEPYLLHARALLHLERIEESKQTIEKAYATFTSERLRIRAVEAIYLYRTNQFDEAIVAAEEVLAHDPNDETALKAKAGSYRLRGDYKSALAVLESSRKTHAESALLNGEYAAVLLASHQAEQALKYAELALDHDPLSELALHTRNLILLRTSGPDAALPMVARALWLNEDNRWVVNTAAENALTRGDASDAMRLAAKARQLDPSSWSTLTFVVDALILADQLPQAIEVVRQSAATAYDPLPHLAALGFLQMDAGDFTAARQTIDAVEKQFPDKDLLWELKIDWHTRQGDVGRAIYLGHQALEKFPDAVDLRTRLASACASVRRYAEGYRVLDAAPADDWTIRAHHVLLHILEGTFDEASRLAEKAIDDYPDALTVTCLRAWLLANNGRFDAAHPMIDDALASFPRSSLPHVVKLDVLMMEGRLSDAVALADRWLPRFRYSHDLNVTAAQAHLLSRKTETALALVNHVLRFDHSSTVAMQIKSMALCDLGRHRKALEVIEEGLAKFPTSMGLVAQRGYVRSKTPGQEALAERDFVMAAHKNPAALLAKTCLGQIAYARRDYRKAQDYFRQVTNAQPHSAAAFTNLAWAYTAAFAAGGLLSDLDDAEDACNTALTLEATCARAIGCRGAIEFHRKRLSLAETLLLQAVTSDPRDIDLAVNLGAFQARIGDYDSGERTLRAALALGTRHGRCYVELSQLLAKQGQLDEARVFARRAIDANPRSSEGWRSMAAVLAASQNLAEAEQTLRQALVRVDGDDNAAVRLDLVRILLISSGSAASDTRNREALEQIAASTSRRDLPQARVLEAMAQLKTGAYQDAQKTLASVTLTPDIEPHVRALQQVANSYVATERRGMDRNQRVAMVAFVMAAIVTIFAMRVNDKLNDASFAVLLPLLLAFAVVVLALPMLASFKLGSTLEAQLALPTREQRNELIAGPSLDLDMPPTAQIVSGTMSFDN
ncbi:MAG TPA: tetratricopeptide repeat protein [Thermoanaerobaculia bacterium]|nr:tetratricopeptide repeat protein [Thermoanaerobaculia bacterium]